MVDDFKHSARIYDCDESDLLLVDSSAERWPIDVYKMHFERSYHTPVLVEVFNPVVVRCPARCVVDEQSITLTYNGESRILETYSVKNLDIVCNDQDGNDRVKYDPTQVFRTVQDT